MSRKDRSRATPREPGRLAQVGNVELRSYDIGALPLINHILDKMRLEQFLGEQLPPDDPRAELPTAQGLMVMVRNVLLSRQPIYGVGEWAARFAPDLFNLWEKEVALLGDDRLGRNMVRAHVGVTPQLVIDFTHQVSATFQLRADEFHNDSTTVSFYGRYASAAEEGERGGRPTPAITFGHSKARRPDLKQLLYTLTINEDGGVPVFFTTSSGNVTDDTTHVETWERVCQLTGKRDFLYVADCKLASKENLAHLAARGGRFVTVLPRSRKEDESFRACLREGAAVAWQTVYDVTDETGEVLDRLSVCGEESVTSDGYRLRLSPHASDPRCSAPPGQWRQLRQLRLHDEILEIHYHVIGDPVLPVAHRDFVGRRGIFGGVVEEGDPHPRAGERVEECMIRPERRFPVQHHD